jgi:deferrochelatase/peroxidase EfeB
MCYQRNIKRQFEFLQSRGVNNANFLHKDTGVDAVIGQTCDGQPMLRKWPATWRAPRDKHMALGLESLVTLKGGEYFFAPSINFLKSL